jgi:tRNA pseudouridine13 synthase
MSTNRKPRARLKAKVEDFIVEEIAAYEASGTGEHLYVTFRKEMLTTPVAANVLARAIGVDQRGVGWAGLKDKIGRTTQTISLPFPIAREAAEARALLEGADPRIVILGVERHQNKLKPGHLRGNRFRVVLRELDASAARDVAESLGVLATTGFPNAYGPQRFGRDGDNPSRTLEWVRGNARPPRDRKEQRLMFSSLQSWLFDEVLARRVADGTWASVLPGDLAKRHDSGGLFDVPLEGPEADDAAKRAQAGEISATGPIFGATMRWPDGAPRGLEEHILAERLGGPEPLATFRQLGEGTRRPLRVFAENMGTEHEPDGLVATFVLPKGCYATTLLGHVCQLETTSNVSTEDRESPGDSSS